jgi:hypothetical protein
LNTAKDDPITAKALADAVTRVSAASSLSASEVPVVLANAELRALVLSAHDAKLGAHRLLRGEDRRAQWDITLGQHARQVMDFVENMPSTERGKLVADAVALLGQLAAEEREPAIRRMEF